MDSSPDSDQTLKQSPWGGNAVQAQIQPQVPQQQVIVIQAKYQPDVNLRTWSIVILICGVAISFLLPIIGLETDMYELFEISSYLCCSSFIVAFILDAVYLKGKSDWETSMGFSTNSTTFSLIVTISFAVIFLTILVFNLLAYY
jgi:hypothetical protein|tara:strand:- start:550 stop:981 length:432 start_codon:yes stop_codon:yes gene_type:complete